MHTLRVLAGPDKHQLQVLDDGHANVQLSSLVKQRTSKGGGNFVSVNKDVVFCLMSAVFTDICLAFQK